MPAPTTTTDFTALRADVAMRSEDTRIAHKHMVEAAARNASPENDAAYERALAWWHVCRIAEHDARGRLIRANMRRSAHERAAARRRAQRSAVPAYDYRRLDGVVGEG